MKIKSILFLISALVISCENASDQRQSAIEVTMDKNAEILLKDSTINAISIGVYHKGETYINHYGEIDKGKGNTPTDETIYEIASVSKTFAGVLVAQAEVDGKLSLEDDIRKYLKEDYPNFEFEGYPIRIKHLISHTSRLPTFLPDTINQIIANPSDRLPFQISEAEENYSRTQFFADLHEIVLDTIPGTRDSYSSVDTELVAHILENVYGKTYNELLQEKISQPLGMTNTATILKASQESKLANGYLDNNQLAPRMVNSLWGAGGGIMSTIPDLMAYAKFQLNKENEVAVKSHDVIFQNGNFQIGYYWPIRFDESYGTFYAHQGGAFGTQNYLFILPEKDLGISVVTNQNISGTSNKLVKVFQGIMEDLK